MTLPDPREGFFHLGSSMISFDAFALLASSFPVVPLSTTMLADTLTPVSTYLRMREAGIPSFILESVEPDEHIGRFSFIGTGPRLLVTARGMSVRIEENGERTESDRDLFETIRVLADRYRSAPLAEPHGLTGGFVGYIGYNTVRSLERIPIPAPGDSDEPDALLGLFTSIVQFDHRRQIMTLIRNVFVDIGLPLRAQYEAAEKWFDELAVCLRTPSSPTTSFACDLTTAAYETPRDHFLASVAQAKEFIREGDIFQVVLSRRATYAWTGDAFAVYRALRMINPSPYLFYLDFGETRLAGSSPEVLVRSLGGDVEVLPIAGTRPRGKTPEEDAALERELLEDTKELAEHVMLVDLGRNDVGRIAQFGSVRVPVFKRVDRYSHVMHIVSEVHGRLRDDVSTVGAFRACFPAGTVSGAPKVRAMEIIQELEDVPRGAYAGAVGYVGLDGTLDTCITIRTVVFQGNHLKIQAGAGIVADSDPAREYEETVNKTRALREAVAMATDGLRTNRLSSASRRRPQ